MEIVKYLTLTGLILSSCISFGQDSGRFHMSRSQAKTILDESLADTSLHFNRNKPLLTKKADAIAFAESVLFDIYGQKNIERQKPYDIFKIDGYWLITGTLPKDYKGGTFRIIIDSRNYQIIQLTHGQ